VANQNEETDVQRQVREAGGNADGSLVFTLAWSGPIDLDFYVTTPLGATLSYQQRTDTTGGQLDIDDTGGSSNVENIGWSKVATPQHGEYTVKVHCFSSSASEPITFDVFGFSFGRELFQLKGKTISPSERKEVHRLSFQGGTAGSGGGGTEGIGGRACVDCKLVWI
jgi:hypothetical protein